MREGNMVRGVRSIGSATQKILDFGGLGDEVFHVVGKAVLSGASQYDLYAQERGYRQRANSLQRRTEAIFLEQAFSFAADNIDTLPVSEIARQLFPNVQLQRMLKKQSSHRSLVLDATIGYLAKVERSDYGVPALGRSIVGALRTKERLTSVETPLNFDLTRVDRLRGSNDASGEDSYLARIHLLSRELEIIKQTVEQLQRYEK